MATIHCHEGRFPPAPRIHWQALVPLIGPAVGPLVRYDGVLGAVHNPRVLLSPLTTQEAVLSSRIEGAQATMGEVLEFEAGQEAQSPRRRDDIHEVLNYRAAMREAERLLETLPLCQRFAGLQEPRQTAAQDHWRQEGYQQDQRGTGDAFRKPGPVPTLRHPEPERTPETDYFQRNQVVLHWYPKIQAMAPPGRTRKPAAGFQRLNVASSPKKVVESGFSFNSDLLQRMGPPWQTTKIGRKRMANS